MRRVAIVCSALGLSAGLFLAGSLGPFAAGGAEDTGSLPDAEALLAPGPLADVGERIANLETRIEQEPDDARAHALLGLAYFAQHNVDEDPAWLTRAETAFGKSLDIQPDDHVETYVGLGILQASRHRFHDALHWGRQARAAQPFSADARGVIVDALVELGRYEQAGDALQAMIDLKPNLSSYARVSYYRELHGDIAGAIRFMTLAFDVSTASPTDAAWAAGQLGELYLSLGRLDDAAREFKRSEFFDPGSWAPEVGLAEIAAARGDLDRAVALVERAAASFPSAHYVELLGDLYKAAGKSAAATEQYARLEEITAAFESNGARTALDSALVAADRGEVTPQSVAEAKTEYERTPSVGAADAYGWTLYAAGDYERAWDLSREALRLGTKSALFHFHAGMIAAALERDDAARRYLSTALEINPHFSILQAPVARRTLAELGP